jgi:hypothetical protein
MEENMKNQETKMDKKLVIITIALGLLVILSGVQSFELVNLKEMVSDENINFASGSGPSSSGSSLSENLANLPTMVGGC